MLRGHQGDFVDRLDDTHDGTAMFDNDDFVVLVRGVLINAVRVKDT